MTDGALIKLRGIVERESGISIGEDKLELLRNRIRKRLRALGVSSEREYLDILETDLDGRELVHLLDVVSTNHTFFYREPEHFRIFRELMVRLRTERTTEIRIWCAASSSGEEPYTLAMICDEVLAGSAVGAKILATDISTSVLAKAVRGVYREDQLAKLPQALRTPYFHPLHDEDENWEVVPSIKKMVIFKKLNLSKFPFPLTGPLDIIFCRNVMIYFDLELRGRIIRECERLLAPGGHLFLSHSENLLGVQHHLKGLEVGVYCKPGRLL